ncbi:FAD-binding protein [Pontibacter silvestris]|uniref:FAD-binding protein n=1 Tax=Pontibacter silvestris TaxID=2305183 RepID=A0ABW4WU70_9BACT|nr:FAD-binding protein [Pontibacter silvestris]MCC9136970.1 FAD-binding protein [Pontibacter silvestris]
MKNWAGNIVFSTENVYYPTSLEEVQGLVKKLDKVKGLGSRHCFNRIADSKYNFLSLKELNKVVALDATTQTVTVEGGIKYGELSPYLHAKGYALANLASLPHISVAGSVITATHGSGVKNGNLATAVSALEIVTADGDVHILSRETDGGSFNGAVVSLGALGIITKVTLDIEPTFMMRQYVYEKLPLSQLQEHFRNIMASGYSVSLFTDWASDYINEVWIKNRLDEGVNFEVLPDFYGATAAIRNMHPIPELPSENCTEQMGVPGSWHERLPHFKMGFTPSSGTELQSEYFVSSNNAVDAILAVARLGKLISPYLLTSEIRTINADNLWMSPCYKQSCVAIHFTWKQDWPAVSQLLPIIEKELSPYNARPHWGKLFTMPAKVLETRYERLPDFKKLMAQYDPQGKFRNDFINSTIFSN